MTIYKKDKVVSLDFIKYTFSKIINELTILLIDNVEIKVDKKKKF